MSIVSAVLELLSDMSKMQRFRSFGSESILIEFDISALKSRALPAIKHPDTGKLLVGRRGETHEDIGDRHGLDDRQRDQRNRGFYDPLTRQYHTKAETGMDSADLMTPYQKMRKFGRFEVLRRKSYEGMARY